jgi:hypothetical protein
VSVKGTYPPSPSGNFEVIESIGVPHPYCITPKHVGVAADHHGGILGESAIEDAEKRGATCGICKGELSFKEHEQALLIDCKVDPKSAEKEVQEWLKSLLPEVEKNGYAGFTFKKSF